MNSLPEEVIRIGQLELRFFVDGTRTVGGLDMFEMTVPESARVPLAHYHREVDEIVYGLEGVLTYTVAGDRRELGPSDRCFIPRGTVHHFANLHRGNARALVALTPASIGPKYFREIGELINRGGPPDPAEVKGIMLRHGLVPVAA